MIAIRRDFCLTRLVVRIRKASISMRLVLGNFKGRPPFPRRFLNLLWNFLAIWMIQQCARIVVRLRRKLARLIDLYEERPLLYNKDKKYRDRDLRSKALAEIASALDIPGLSIQLAQNMQLLNNNYFLIAYLFLIAVGEVDKK